ncbi:MAG: Ig-like domain-containing protein, partial [Spirochaetota bacterium]
ITNVVVMLHGGTYSGYNPGNYLTYLPTNMAVSGAYAEAHESYGCVPDSFFETRLQTQFPESLYYRLGYATYSGAVAEPYLGFLKASSSTNDANNLRAMLLQGFTTLEASFFASWSRSRGPNTFVGDPLSRPFIAAPAVSFALAHGAMVSGSAAVSVNASSSAGIGRTELFIDGARVTNVASGSMTFPWDTTLSADGEHTLYAAAYDPTTMMHAGSASISVIVTNSGSIPPPAAPRDLARSMADTNAVALSWFDASSSETAFNVYRSPDNVTYSLIGVVGANTTVFTNGGLLTNVKYYYTVAATNNAGLSALSSPITVLIIPPMAPSSPAISSATSNTITITWSGSGVTNETGYNVYRSVNSGPFSIVSGTAVDTTWFYNSSLTTNVLYAYQVSATNEYGESARTASIPYMITPPAIATGVAVSTTNSNSLVLSWVDNATNEIVYRILRSTNGTAYSALGYVLSNISAYTDTTAIQNTLYYYKVQGTNKLGDGILSAAGLGSIPTPHAPSSLAITQTNAGALILVWTDNATNELQYLIYRGIGDASYTAIGSVPPNASSYTDTTFTIGPMYTYKVLASNGYGHSAFAGPVSPVDLSPAAPTALASAMASGTITISWTDNATNETQFSVERSSDNSTFESVGTAAVDDTSFDDGSVPDFGRWYYRVAATNAFGSSVSSTIFVDVYGCTAPTGLTAAIASSNTVVLNWIDNATNEIAYIVYRYDTLTWTTVYFTNLMNTTCYTDIGLNTNVTYYYYIIATSGFDDAWSSGKSVRIVVAPPADPTAPSAVQLDGSTVRFNWTDNATNEMGYNIYRSTDGVTYTKQTMTTTNAVQFDDGGLSLGATYYYRVAATNVFGESARTAPVSVTMVLTVSLSDAAGSINAAANSVRIAYVLSKNCTNAARITFSYSVSAQNAWTNFDANGATNRTANGASSNEWVIPTGFDTTKRYDIRIVADIEGTASAPVTITGLDFNRFFTLAADLNRAAAANNPYRGEAEGIVFVNLTAAASVKIYTITGRYVADLPAPPSDTTGRRVWNVRTTDGRRVAPGVYICVIVSGGEKRSLKVMVAR